MARLPGARVSGGGTGGVVGVGQGGSDGGGSRVGGAGGHDGQAMRALRGVLSIWQVGDAKLWGLLRADARNSRQQRRGDWP